MIHPVLLCGGSGTRLWPVSRNSLPKQFAALLDSESLFQSTALRLSGLPFVNPLVVTPDRFRFLAAQQLNQIHVRPSAFLIEPDVRNTAPAVLAAALWLLESDSDPLMLIAPSDHIIPDVEQFRNSVFCALPAAQAGNIVTFGIAPNSPETGYYYLELAADADPRMNEIQRVVRVVEKPNYARACEMLEGGNFLWSAGVFLTKASTIVSAFEEHAAEMVPLVRRSLEEAGRSSNVIALTAEPWGKLPNLSVDYAVMAASNKLYVMPYSGRWSDLGCWQAVREVCEKDKMGSVVAGNSLAIDCQGTMLRSESENMIVVGVGLRDLVAIATPDAILVAKASEAQRVKDAVQELKNRGARQATSFHFDRRPWGRFETMANGSRYHVKRIVVEPSAALSLQSHKFRAEHWIVVQGTARVTVNESVSVLEVNEHIYIPLGAIHRLENPGDGELVLIEVQTGSYFGEDDIVRYEDMYSRS